MHIVKYKDYEIIFDDKDVYDLITKPFGRKKNTKKKVWVDDSTSNPYAMTYLDYKNVKIHHIIIGTPINGLMVDHLNGNSLDNRRENLKIVTRHENCTNKNMNTKYKRWVSKTKNGKYAAKIRIPLGSYETEQEAHNVALEFMQSYFKDIYIKPEYLL